MPVTGCFFLKMAATLINVAITSTQNNYMFLVVALQSCSHMKHHMPSL